MDVLVCKSDPSSHKNGREENIDDTKQKNVCETSVQDGDTMVLYWGSSILSTPFSIWPILAVTEYINLSRIKRMYYSWHHDKTITAKQKYFEYWGHSRWLLQ